MISDQFVILADESADWKIAGLRQLDRLVLALDECAGAKSDAGKLIVAVWWKPDLPRAARWLPNESLLSHVRLTDQLPAPAQILSTHLFVHRNAVGEFLAEAAHLHLEGYNLDSLPSWQELSDQFTATCPNIFDGTSAWRFVLFPREIASAEARFLQRTGKTQDGFVSRWLNRPLTRPLTRLLLKLPLEPTTWTLAIFILPLMSCFFLSRGDYASFVIGTAIYQLYSMLDGCDGEIARAKFLESRRGGQIDNWCDITGAVLFVIGLGVGLMRSRATWVYAAEGLSLAALIAVNEWALRIPAVDAKPAATELTNAAYPRHQRLIERAGLSRFGEKLVPLVLQTTKRDVGILFFLLLAICGIPQWILHPWLVVTVATLSLSAISYGKARA